MTQSPLAVARALHRALSAGQHGAALQALFAADATTVEHPNLIKPQGATASLEQMLAASQAGASLLASQRYEEHSGIEHGNLAIMRMTWTGVIARDVGPFHAGQTLTAHIAQFIETRDGHVTRIETYDCYEPFAPSTP